MTPLQAAAAAVHRALHQHPVWPLVLQGTMDAEATGPVATAVCRALQSVGAPADLLEVHLQTIPRPGDTAPPATWSRTYLRVNGQPMAMGWTSSVTVLANDQAAVDQAAFWAEGQAGIGRLGRPQRTYRVAPFLAPDVWAKVIEAASPELASVAELLLSRRVPRAPTPSVVVRL